LRLVAAFVVVIGLQGAGVVLAIRRLDTVAGARIAAIRAEEDRSAAVQRLRWSAELMVSTGRGYLLSGAPEHEAKLHQAAEDFGVHLGRLEQSSVSAVSRSLLAEVERAADQFRRHQAALVAARADARDPEQVARRFEEDLRPSRVRLSQALDHLVEQKEAHLHEIYAQVATDRRHLMSSTWAVLLALTLTTLAIAAVFAGLLLRAYRTEEEARARAQRAVSARDELLGVVAHDLRSPLGAIMMKAGTLQRQRSPEAVAKQAASIENVALRMDFIIKSLLDAATLETGKFSINTAPCPVEALLQETADLFGSAAAARSIVLDRAAADPDLVLQADRDRLLQVLSNLVGNALKFTPPSGHVGFGAERRGETVRFSVTDTGPGISATDVPHVFERFWKQEKRDSKGTGLGLFIAHHIVEAHGGRIWVESEPGHGATFHFEIPGVMPARAIEPAARTDTGRSPDAPAGHH
jgi:signal transduction histidine kinase